MKTIVPFFTMFVDPPSTFYERIYRLSSPATLPIEMDMLLRECSTKICRTMDSGFIRIISWRSRGLCRRGAPGNECGGELGATVCILGEKVLNWKFLRVNDKQSIARNSIETGKRVAMMNSAMTLGVAVAVTGGLVVAWRKSAFM
jgi:hypothetical protein